ncbi:ATP-dependent DNA helicase [Trichonephila clavipes]|nr:ATP-dependent DNA helicase [Trichonephila clavipes]
MPEDISFGWEMVPMNRRSSTVSLNQNRSIHAKRNHFPLKPACSLTIHKLRGGTFGEIVYKCSKAHSQPLVYVALSRLMAQEKLHFVPTDGRQRFYHGRRSTEAMLRFTPRRAHTLGANYFGWR